MGSDAAQARQEIAREVLLAPLRMPTTKWSSRSLAEALGISQSRVARAWAPMRQETPVTRELASLAGSGAVGLAGILVRPRYSLMVLELGAGPPVGGASRTVFSSPAVERSIRTILAAELARDRIPETAPSSEEAFWATMSRPARSGGPHVAVASAPVSVPSWLDALVVCDGLGEWLSLFGVLGGSRRHHDPARLHAAESALREWFLRPSGDLAWSAHSVSPSDEAAGAGRTLLRNLSLERALADEIVATIRSAVTDGRLAGGDHVTDRYLATRLHTSRAQVRSAMRLLERDGLLTVSAGHTAVIPVPEVADVVETYAARQALGAMVVRAATRWSPDQRAAVEAALADVRRHAVAGDVYLTGQADTTFQDRLADASGLVRIAPVMHILADHLRVFIAVMGLDYAYPADAILRDDEAIHAALVAQDADLAAELWRQKIANARTYMVDRLTAARRRPRRRR